MNKIKKISLPLSLSVLVIILSAVFSASYSAAAGFDASNMITKNGYKYYRAWSQDQYPWHNTKPSDAWETDWMNKYGCSTVAMAKMFVEAGVADPEKTTPGTLMTKYGSPSKGIGDVGIYWSTLGEKFGMTCYSYQYYPVGTFYNTAMSFFNNTSRQYHLLLKVTGTYGNTHYVQVDRQATIAAGEIVINNSTNTSDGTTRYSTAEEYYKNVALQKLSQTSYYPDYFVVYYHNDTLKLKSAEQVSGKYIKINWYPNGSCQNYVVYRREKGETSWTGKRIANIKAVPGEGIRSYTDKNVSYSKEYEYTVRGYYTVNSTNKYIGYDKTGLDITLSHSAPKLKTITSVDHKTVKLTWAKVDDCEAYRVYRKKKGDTSWTIVSKKTTALSYTDKTVDCGTQYTYTVRAFDKLTSKLGVWNKTGVSITPVPALTTLKSTSSEDFNKIKISWNKVADVDGYAIYRKSSTESSYKKIAEVSGVNTLSTTDASTLVGEEYTYMVRAYKTVNDKNYYGAYDKTGITGKSYTKAPVISSYKSTQSDKLKLTWKKVNGANGYIVYRRTSSDTSYTKIGTVSGNGNVSYTDSGLKCCVKYYYKVKAYRTRSGKNYAGYASAAKIGYTNPADPKNLKAKSVNYKTIKVEWSSVKDATGYIVYRRTTGNYSVIARLNSKTLTYSDNTVTTGVNYEYAVCALCSKNGLTMYSACKNFVTAHAYPATPKLVSATSSEYNEINFKWGEVSGSTGYVVYRKLSTDKQYSVLNRVIGKSNITYKDTNVSCGKKYSYTVKAYRTVNGVEYYSDNYSGVSVTAQLSKPKLKVSSSNYKTLDIFWNKVKGASGYRIYYKKASDKSWSELGTFANGELTSCSHTNLITGTEYKYTLRAFRTEGKSTYWSDYIKAGVSGTPLTVTPKITSVKSVKYNIVSVNWQKSGGASGYRVYRKLSGSKKWTAIATLSGNGTLTYTDKTVSCGVKYDYTVRGYKTINKSKKYGYYNKTGVSVTTIPDTPSLTAESSTYNKIQLKWKKSGGADGYKIYRKVEGGTFKLVKDITSASTLSYKDTVECGANYIYYATAYVKVGKVEYGSFDSKQVKCKAVPITPTLKTAVSSKKATAVITWDSVSGASGYYVYRKDSDGTYKLIYDILSAKETSFTDTNVKSGEKYTYTVSAYRICPIGYIEGSYNKNGITVTVK
ncbi:MAG: hypothetical protein IJV39_02485 [Ruminococcus sp.]|nr:hypothetical protein [Ruminococcus sp.]